MNNFLFYRLATLALFTLFLAGCQPYNGPYEGATQSYALSNFDRLDMGSAFKIDVRSGSTFAVEVKGNRKDIDDLDVVVRNGTLHAQYRSYLRSRRYDMTFSITMPTLRAVNFSGASQSTISGFTNLPTLAIDLSGASKSVISVNAARLSVSLSGASTLTGTGNGTDLLANLSGASRLETVDYPVSNATLDLSGASNARVQVSNALTVKASGASKVRYRGTPRVDSDMSGASTVGRD